MNANPKRRIILIDTRFQLRLAGGFILLQLLLTGLFAIALYVFMDSELKAGLASAHAAYRSLDQMLFPLVLVLAGFNLALSTSLVTGFVVLLSHRIAGPLYRFRRTMEDLAGRRLDDLNSLRPEDQLGALSEPTRQALATVRSDLDALRQDLARVRQSQAAGNTAGVEAGIEALEARLSAWRIGG